MKDLAALSRRELVVGGSAAVGLVNSPQVFAAGPSLARYRVTFAGLKPLRFLVIADVPIEGDRLLMADTYPAELPEMASRGWPALISDLAVTDAAGRKVTATPEGSGWRLGRHIGGRAQLRYIVDFRIFEAAGWSSPRESAIADAEHAVVSCRALFITTPSMAGAEVSFRSLDRWQAVSPWPQLGPAPQSFRAITTDDLTENMLVMASRPPARISAAGFAVTITAMGHWAPLRTLVAQTMRTILALQTGMMGTSQSDQYSIILVPTDSTGGDAYRQSFAYAFETPSAGNRPAWANTLAHEFFHYWNASRLQGQDYSASQWFQEGFTEYVANLTTLVGDIALTDEFIAKLSGHVANYSRLTTTLENIGTRKGPPLYSAGALVAFSFDAMIRRATAGERTIGNFFRNLWRLTGEGRRKYAWRDIQVALEATARGDWQAYYARHIRGTERLPLEQVFPLAGLQIKDSSIVLDPAAPPAAKLVWESIKSRM